MPEIITRLSVEMSLRDWPIKQKLTAMLLLISGLVLLLTSAAFVTYQVVAFRQTTLKNLSTLGRVIASNGTASLAFANEADAREILSALRTAPHVVAAGLYDKDGRLFSQYPANPPGDALPVTPARDGYRFEHGYVIGLEPVAEVGNARLGTLYLRSDMTAVSRTLRLSAAIAVGIMAISLLAAYFLSAVVQGRISLPILALAETAKAVSTRQDYSVRAPKLGADELGALTDAFNQMLGRIEESEEDQRRHATELERRVAERTHELQERNEALRHSDARFRAILEAAPDAMVIADRNGRIVLVNRQTENLFGYSRQEVVGMPVESLLPNRFRESHVAHRTGYLREPVWRPMGRDLELFALRKDGSEFPVDISLGPLETDQGTLVMAAIRDTTERKRTADALGASRARLAALSRKLLQAQELERMRIARDLHDQVGQALTAVKLNVEALRRAAPKPGPSAPFTETIQAVDHAIEDVRALSLELRPALLDDLGLAAAVTAYAKRHATRAGLKLGLTVSQIGQWVPKDVEIACFRVLQEMVTNVVRHSGARRLDIRLQAEDGSLQLEVGDDGRGFDARGTSASADGHDHLGLLGMQERAELVGGEIAVDSQPGMGTVVRARFPMARPRRSLP